MTVVRTGLAACAGTLVLMISTTAEPALELTGADFDFGLVARNSTVRHQVWIHNLSEDSIRIADIKTGCGCLSGDLPPDRFAPGDSLAVVFYWQTRGAVGEVSTSAYLYTESGERPLEALLTAQVVTYPDSVASTTWTPDAVTFSAHGHDEELSRSFSVANRLGTDLALTVVEVGPELILELPDSVAVSESATGRVTIDSSFRERDFESSFTVELTGNQEFPFRVTIPVVSGDFSFRPIFTTTIQ